MEIKISNTAILIFCLMISFSSCKGSDKNESIHQETDNEIMEFPGDTVAAASDIIPFPKNVEIILPMAYRKDDTGYPVTVEGKEWYEIYKNNKNGKWMVAKADLNVRYDNDPCSGLDVMIINSKHKDAVLFFTPFEGLSENQFTVLEDKPLIPGNSVIFKMNDKEYSLSASGTDDEGNILSAEKLPEDSEGNIYFDAKNFKLFFSSDDAKSYPIAEVDEIYDSNPKMIWAGDLNADGLPDMILDLSQDYESRHLYFFLSDQNDSEKPLKKIGDGLVVFDC